MQRAGRFALIAIEVTSLTALVLAARCADYRDVFAGGGQICFVDGDCYARMIRARICLEHPGTVVRRHDFENFPVGTSPHTTAPLDYIIAALAEAMTPFGSGALDLAGALVSPLIAIGLGVFLWWWSREMRFRYALLLLYALSPILAHGMALGRPDHQSLIIALVLVAICAEWTLSQTASAGWSIVSGASWALALWVSFYEPLVLLLIVIGSRPRTIFKRERRAGWIVFCAILLFALLVERRIPQWPDFSGLLTNWGSTIGELSRVRLRGTIWFEWCGWLLVLVPVLIWKKRPPAFLIALLCTTFLLTVWQARWGYFFAGIFVLLAPELLCAFKGRLIASAVFLISLYPIAKAWDHPFSEDEQARRAEFRLESGELRAIASHVDGAFLSPWWFSPAIAYWSRQPGVAGTSHEAISGTKDSAQFFATDDFAVAGQICAQREIKWIVSYDADRTADNCSRILGHQISSDALCRVLDRAPSRAPFFLRLIGQTARFKLYQPRKI